MVDERADVPLRSLTRWIVIVAVVVVGILLYFRLAPRTRPLVPATGTEVVQ
jgi:hypothetical protein